MVFFNHATRQMTAKIVYYGPGLCGKTTNLSAIYERTSQKARGEMVSLNTETDRTLFFDLLPMEVGVIGGFKAKLQLYTVPGQVFYNSTRKLVLKGVDGIVFVADSQLAMLDANRESIQNLTENLRELGLKIGDIPMVFQWNKRDLKAIVPAEQLERELNPRRLTSYEAVACTGEGVFETLRGISRLALAQIKQQHLGDGPAPQAPQAPVAQAPPAQAPPAQAPPAQAPEAPPAPPQTPAPVVPAWSAPTPATTTPQPIAALPAAPPPPAAMAGAGSGETHPGRKLPEALSFLDLSGSQGETSPGRNLPEALSFLDLASALDLFETIRDEEEQTLPGLPAEPAESLRPEAQVKVMAPLVVKLLPPQPAKSSGGTHPGISTGTGAGVPRIAIKAPVPHSPLRGLLPIHPWPAGAGAKPGPVLHLNLPPETDGGELEVHVRITRKGRLLAESATAIPGPGPDGTGSLSIEFKRS